MARPEISFKLDGRQQSESVVRYVKKTMRYLVIIFIYILKLNLTYGQVAVSNDSVANKALEWIWTIDWRFDDKLYALGGDDKL